VKHFPSVPLLGRLVALPTNIRLDRKSLPRTKNSSLFGTFVIYGRKKLYNIGPWNLIKKLFTVVTYSILIAVS
jgi:hypothetical protein